MSERGTVWSIDGSAAGAGLHVNGDAGRAPLSISPDHSRPMALSPRTVSSPCNAAICGAVGLAG